MGNYTDPKIWSPIKPFLSIFRLSPGGSKQASCEGEKFDLFQTASNHSHISVKVGWNCTILHLVTRQEKPRAWFQSCARGGTPPRNRIHQWMGTPTMLQPWDYLSVCLSPRWAEGLNGKDCIWLILESPAPTTIPAHRGLISEWPLQRRPRKCFKQWQCIRIKNK